VGHYKLNVFRALLFCALPRGPEYNHATYPDIIYIYLTAIGLTPCGSSGRYELRRVLSEKQERYLPLEVDLNVEIVHGKIPLIVVSTGVQFIVTVDTETSPEINLEHSRLFCHIR
jgi:hypothetical protein